MYKEPGNLTNVQLALHYFTQLNPFPSKKCINDNLDKLDGKYDKIFKSILYEQDKLLPKNGNKCKHYKKACQNPIAVGN